MENEKDYDYFQMDILSRGSVKKTVKAIIENDDFEVDDINEEVVSGGKKGTRILSVFMLAHRRRMKRLTFEIKRALKVQEVSFFPVNNKVLEGFGDAKHRAKKNEEVKSLGKSKKFDDEKSLGKSKKNEVAKSSSKSKDED